MAWPTTSRHERGYGREHERKRKLLLAREPLCRECKKRGLVTVATIADHVIAKAKGGSDDIENYQPMCVPCHDEKTVRESGGKPRQEVGPDGWPVEEAPSTGLSRRA